MNKDQLLHGNDTAWAIEMFAKHEDGDIVLAIGHLSSASLKM